ncbi:thiamine phosphate synthase [Shewanella sp. SR44-3]|uniref:thiamine phosphate synthase n=1 Tax=Shewanella sp. SR44-3 TaxID=2760936 RepID=UPI0015FAC8CF|nr:thiamine phosphate synthase [Shewanella sp. SR44-3]MBB1270439.1 thiamine phosphate synthase [Shewanella sp. SR44-3]
MNTPPKIVWTIAGSDSGGGAGIQADLATAQDLGCHCATVITTVTAQNSVSVSLVESVSAAMLLAQLNSLARDLPPAAIKIGLLASQQQLDVVANWLKRFTQGRYSEGPLAVILDPVMVASSGDRLNLSSETDTAFRAGSSSGLDFSPFKGLLSLITPNQQELQHLVSGLDYREVCQTSLNGNADSFIDNQAEFIAKTQALAQALDCHVLAKGGDGQHWQGNEAIDCYVCHQVEGASLHHDNATYLLTHTRINTGNNHGTGCTLSAAIASFMAQDFVLHDAIVLAKAYVTKGLINSYQPGAGPGSLARTGWANDLTLFPRIARMADANNHQGKSDKASESSNLTFKKLSADLGIYPVVDSVALLKELLEAGCRTIQLRLKSDSKCCQQGKPPQAQQLELQIINAIELGRTFNAQVFINDHWQLALKHQAFGIHLGQEDLFEVDLNAISGAGMALGLSSHSYFEILLAHQLRPSYIALGHIFPTPTKTMASKPQGLIKLNHYARLLHGHYPTVAIGGIDSQCLAGIKATGVSNAAVVRALTQAADPKAAFDELTEIWYGKSILALGKHLVATKAADANIVQSRDSVEETSYAE